MGYCIEIELKNVRFKKSDQQKMLADLHRYNTTVLIPESDWCRFDKGATFEETIEQIGFWLNEDETYGYFQEFTGEKLGRHEEILRLLAPYLDDCEIKFTGEDDAAWKFKIINGVAQESIYREEF